MRCPTSRAHPGSGQDAGDAWEREVLGSQAMYPVRELYQAGGWDPVRKEVGVAPAVHMVPDDRDP